MKANPELIQKFTDAIYKGQRWYFSHSSEEIADAIIDYFPGTDKETIVTVVNNYKEIDALAHSPEIKEEDMNRLMDIITQYDNSLIPKKPAFNSLVDNSYAQKTVLSMVNNNDGHIVKNK